MLPKHRSDYRTLLWVGMAAATVAVQFANPSLVKFLWPLSCYFALACGVIAHNHNHCPTFTNRRLNRTFGNILSIFYGYVTLGWIPTHNQNHHRYVNREGDATITWRHTNKHTFLVAATYPLVSIYHQSPLIGAYLRESKAHPERFRRIVTQYVVWAGAVVGGLALAIWLHGVATGLMVWTGSMAVPGMFSLWMIMVFNYEQHVHTDPFSEHDHSRNFVSPVLNFLLFNNGLHTVHHERAGRHWSELKQAHAALEDEIHPSLLEPSLLGYWFRQYVLTKFDPSLGTTQHGAGPMHPPMAVRAAS